MELEAENLWIHSASHDFYDKKMFIKNIMFSCRKTFSKKSKKSKFSLKINIFFKKVEKNLENRDFFIFLKMFILIFNETFRFFLDFLKTIV